ncbi:MAG: TRC40/GET3/ArsA family transport-energizing ATPase, partial [Calditrichaceae bacterium]
MARHLFFLGKGGVGKSTLSAIEGLKSAKNNQDTLIVSMDPAHNQSDIFQTQFTDKPKPVCDNLTVLEIAIEKQVKNYLHEIETRLKDTYRYLTAFNLEDHFGIIRYSPGIEEYALLRAYKEISDKFQDKDLIVFDMPPTALTLKFFSLPKLSLLWLDKLLEIRERIIGKKQIITKIKFAGKNLETDKIIKNLDSQIKNYERINKNLQDKSSTNIILVLNPDRLSANESIRIFKQLQ